MRRAVCRAVALAAFSVILAVPATGPARAADCWLLKGAALERAREQGRCADAFARGVPAVKRAPVTKAKGDRPARAKPASKPTLTDTLKGLLGAEVKAVRPPRGGIDHLSYGRPDGPPVQR